MKKGYELTKRYVAGMYQRLTEDEIGAPIFTHEDFHGEADIAIEFAVTCVSSALSYAGLSNDLIEAYLRESGLIDGPEVKVEPAGEGNTHNPNNPQPESDFERAIRQAAENIQQPEVQRMDYVKRVHSIAEEMAEKTNTSKTGFGFELLLEYARIAVKHMADIAEHAYLAGVLDAKTGLHADQTDAELYCHTKGLIPDQEGGNQ